MKKLVVLAAAFMLVGAIAAQAAPRKESPRPRINRAPATGVLAQHEGWFVFVPEAGLVVPTGSFGNAFNTGFRFQGAAEYYLRNDWTIGVTTAFAQSGVKSDIKTAAEAALTAQAGTPVTISSWRLRTMQYGAYARHLFATTSPKICPFVSGGLGLYHMSTSASGSGATQQQIDAETGSGSSATNFGFNLGGGVMMGLTPNMGFNVGMTYHDAFSDPATNYFTFNGGLNFFFNTGR